LHDEPECDSTNNRTAGLDSLFCKKLHGKCNSREDDLFDELPPRLGRERRTRLNVIQFD
jgi:hypothetical protein